MPDTTPAADRITTAWLASIGFARADAHYKNIRELSIPSLHRGARSVLVRAMDANNVDRWAVSLCRPDWSYESDQIFITGVEFRQRGALLALLSALGWNGVAQPVPE